MSYAVRAWRDTRGGTCGISIGTVFPVGWDNHVAEVILDESEIEGFFIQCKAALERAKAASGALDEPMPGAYEVWS